MKLQRIIIVLFFFSCRQEQPQDLQALDHQRKDSKRHMKLEVELKEEVPNGYTISWYDTLYQNLDKLKRPFEIHCDIMDRQDTAGYYHGLKNPSTWTSFGTQDSLVMVYFYITRNVFSELPKEQQQLYPDMSCKFLPVKLSVKSGLETRIPLVLIEQ